MKGRVSGNRKRLAAWQRLTYIQRRARPPFRDDVGWFNDFMAARKRERPAEKRRSKLWHVVYAGLC